jgi:hypothetical protein
MADNKKLTTSIALGTLLIPLSAFAASVLVKDAPPVESTISVTSPAVPVAATGFATQTASAADLQAACGVEGLRLVQAETDQSISSIQQAALDALREICAQEGMPLPGKPAPEPVTQTVVVNAAPSNSISQAPSNGQSETEHEEEHEEEHEHDEHEEEGDD